MNLGSNGLALIKHFEQCRLTAFKPIPTDPWTIGWGCTKDIHEGQTCTQEEADEMLAHDVANAVAGVNLLVKVPVSQNAFDALVSFAYNVGTDIDADNIAEGLGDSTLLRKLNEGFTLYAADEFLKWDKSKGIKLAGLTRRREAERRLFLTPDIQKFMLEAT
jgi:lysozyme